MAFPDKLASTLTGASVHQLRAWRQNGIMVPEVQAKQPALYSYRDLVALRTITFLRAKLPLQRIGKAFQALKELDLTDHPSRYQFGTDGEGITVDTGDGDILELYGNVGQRNLFRFEQIFRPFENLQGETVVDFEHPRKNLDLIPGRLGGWPTIHDTRVPYDTVASLLKGGDYSLEDVQTFFPAVSIEAAQDAISFDNEVENQGLVSA
jgi:uncharacterized protein (DUF433 family)